MQDFLTQKKYIIDWLKKYGVKRCTLVEDSQYGFVVDVDSDVILNDRGLKSIPVKFNNVKGYFSCSVNALTQLDFAPVQCEGFDCSINKLSRLLGAPQKIKGSFFCNDNKLTSLIGGPQDVDDDYYCFNNNLKNLKGVPEIIGADFFCGHNPLTSLHYCPKDIGGEFSSDFCSLKTLKYLPKNVWSNEIDLEGNEELGETQDIRDFNELQKRAEVLTKIELERKKLNRILSHKSPGAKIHKI